jgi:hypothetical protein
MTPPPPKPRGRPRVDPPGTSVSTWIRPNEYELLRKMAVRRDTSVSAMVRILLKHNLPR